MVADAFGNALGQALMPSPSTGAQQVNARSEWLDQQIDQVLSGNAAGDVPWGVNERGHDRVILSTDGNDPEADRYSRLAELEYRSQQAMASGEMSVFDIEDAEFGGGTIGSPYAMDTQRTLQHMKGYADTWAVVKEQIAERDAMLLAQDAQAATARSQREADNVASWRELESQARSGSNVASANVVFGENDAGAVTGLQRRGATANFALAERLNAELPDVMIGAVKSPIRGAISLVEGVLNLGNPNSALTIDEWQSSRANVTLPKPEYANAAQIRGGDASDMLQLAAGVPALLRAGAVAAERVLVSRLDDVATNATGRGVYFFNQQVLPYINRTDATLGRAGEAHFFMPLEDSAVVTDAASAYRYTGGAPSLERAYTSGGNVFGVEFPLNGLFPRLPRAADTTHPHFFEGGNTALRLPNGGGYLVNPTREFVVPGGSSIPSGSTLFKIGPDGTRIPIREW